MIVAQANEPLDAEGHFVNNKVAVRGVKGEITLAKKRKRRLYGRFSQAGSFCCYCDDSVP